MKYIHNISTIFQIIRVKPVFIILFSLLTTFLQAQLYTDYLGAGHNAGVTVTASSTANNTSPGRTMDGSGMNQRLFDASRFFGQASFGVQRNVIEGFSTALDYEGWIDNQFTR